MMATCTPSLFSGGDACIAWVATHLRHTWLTPMMLLFTEIGEVGPTLFAIALIYWLWNKRHGKYLGYGLFLTIFINILVKGWVKECRPPAEFWLEQVSSFSFPSGHAQVGIYLWFGLAYYLRTSWLSVLCVLNGVMIALSRPYLGVHYPQDIAAGALLGISALLIIIWCEKKELQPLRALSLWGQTGVLLVILTIYTLIIDDPRETHISSIGTFLGFWLGIQYESRGLHFQPLRQPLALISQVFIGCAGILLFWKGGDWIRHQVVSDLTVAMKYIQYFLLGFWITFGAPILVFRLGINKQQVPLN